MAQDVPEIMRAMVIDAPGGPDALRPADVPVPLRVMSEALVRIEAAAVNPIDAKTRAGGGVSAAIQRYPAILGHDFSGVVVETPYAEHPLQPGDEVYGMATVPRVSGSYAEYAAIPTLNLARKPAALSHIEAAGVPLAALTAWGAVVDVAKVHEGQRILIHAGAGGVGHFAVQLAAYFGGYVITTASERNADWLRSLGAAEVIDYRATRFEDAVDGVDVVIDLIGNVKDDTGTRSLSVLRRDGLIVNVPSSSWPTMGPEAEAAGVRSTGFKLAADGSTLATIARLIDSGDLSVRIDEVFPLEKLPDAHRKIEDGHTAGKIAIAIAP